MLFTWECGRFAALIESVMPKRRAGSRLEFAIILNMQRLAGFVRLQEAIWAEYNCLSIFQTTPPLTGSGLFAQLPQTDGAKHAD
ncbi:hypothetical protein GCM10027046_06400 [Uliginosibacterium flavum]|uniref:Uncharacterized protein n=1 Tax=Uliginosibacterium flavum TaxID=1396831 RepID=A0ABV2TIQ1_9RHOO